LSDVVDSVDSANRDIHHVTNHYKVRLNADHVRPSFRRQGVAKIARALQRVSTACSMIQLPE
jgi:hypothetical protein